MTMPDERTRALLQTRAFLQELCESEKMPDVPDEVRRQARVLLRHYPQNMHLQLLAQALPRWFAPLASQVPPAPRPDGEPRRPTLDDLLEERRSGRPWKGPDSR